MKATYFSYLPFKTDEFHLATIEIDGRGFELKIAEFYVFRGTISFSHPMFSFQTEAGVKF